jgi:histidinol-phosphate phosphatase family protein
VTAGHEIAWFTEPASLADTLARDHDIPVHDGLRRGWRAAFRGSQLRRALAHFDAILVADAAAARAAAAASPQAAVILARDDATPDAAWTESVHGVLVDARARSLRERAWPVPDGVAVGAPLADERILLRRQLRLPARAQLFLQVGALVPGAGHATTLEAWAELRRRLPAGAKLPLIGFLGTGPAESDLHVLAHDLGIKDQVWWIGHRKEVRRYLGAADGLVAPTSHGSRWDVLDAMACGIAVITAEAPAWMQDGRDGKRIVAGDAMSLADAIAPLVGAPDAVAQLGRAAHAAVVQNASHAQLAAAVAAVVLASRRARGASRNAPAARPALFVDRDGTLVRNVPYNADPAAVVLEPGAALALRWLRGAGLRIVLVTNQSAVARGHADAAAVDAVHARLRELLREQGADLDAVYFCPHHPDFGPACDCRKPEPGMLLRAAREHGIDLGRSVTVGDAERDLEAGRRAGTAVLGYTGRGGETPAASSFAPGTRLAHDWIAVALQVLEWISETR